jgi:hypothetical protein
MRRDKTDQELSEMLSALADQAAIMGVSKRELIQPSVRFADELMAELERTA